MTTQQLKQELVAILEIQHKRPDTEFEKGYTTAIKYIYARLSTNPWWKFWRHL